MKLAITHLWVLACVAFGLAIFMAVERRLEVLVFFAVFLLLLICTRSVGNKP